MNERSSNSMLSFEADTLFCELKEKFIFAMPRVVPDQRATYESDELFRKLSRECEVRYTGFRDRPMDERQLRFQAECREGHADVAFVCTGTTLQLNFSANSWSERAEDRVLTREYVDFDSEPGRVHLKSQFILNGVCVLWRGYIDLIRLDGMACLEFDRERAEAEASLLREQVEQTSRSVHQFEDRRRQNQLDHERQERQERQQACSEAESRSGRRKNRCKRDINLPVFISSGNHGNIFNNPHRPGFGNSSDHSHYPSNINLNNNSPTTTSIINSINSIRTHILNNAHLHSHYHPQFQHHQHHHHHHHHQHRRRQLCECCPTLSLPTTTLSTARSRNTITKEDVKSSPEDIPEDLSSPQKPTSDSAKDKHTDTTSSWNEKNKEADPVEEEIEIDVVEVEADPDSDIDIEGEDEVDEQTHVLAGDLDKTKAGNEVSASPPREQTTSILPAKTTEPDAHKHGSDNPDAVTGAADLNLSFYDKSTSAKKTSPDRKSAGTRSFSADDVMEGVENVDIGSRRRKNSDAGESPSAEHAGSAEVRSEGSGSDNMAPREVDNSATARDKRRKSDTIWSPWK